MKYSGNKKPPDFSEGSGRENDGIIYLSRDKGRKGHSFVPFFFLDSFGRIPVLVVLVPFVPFSYPVLFPLLPLLHQSASDTRPLRSLRLHTSRSHVRLKKETNYFCRKAAPPELIL